MNIFKNKHWSMVVAVIVLLIFFIQTPLLTAKERRGAKVVVTMTDGSTVKGELLAVKTDALLVFDRAAYQGKSIDLQQVVQVKIIKKSNAMLGMVLGLLAGIPISSSVAKKQCCGDDIRTIVTMPPMFVLFGGLFGALSGIDIKYSFAGSSAQISQENLEELKKYAREQDS